MAFITEPPRRNAWPEFLIRTRSLTKTLDLPPFSCQAHTYAARARKHVPTIRSVACSIRLLYCSSASSDIRQSRAAAEVTSTKLSTPKPTRDMLPALAPATTATIPSRQFQPIVKYSSLFPRRTIAWRSETSSAMHTRVSGQRRRRISLCFNVPSVRKTTFRDLGNSLNRSRY